MRDAVIRMVFGRHPKETTGATAILLLSACALLLAWKGWAIARLNVNWDEFFFLSHVHALLRGDLVMPYQTAFTQAFRWLPLIGDTELAQIHAGRWVMLALLALATVQLIRLASRWVSPNVAIVTALAFLCISSSQRHGASFRSDSMLLPVLLAALLLLTRASYSRRGDIVLGLLCGLGLVINVKFALFAPLFMACVLLADNGARESGGRMKAILIRFLIIGAATLSTAAVLVMLHHLALTIPTVEGAATFANRSAGKTLMEAGFLPYRNFLWKTLRTDWFFWSLMAAGWILAMIRRRWVLAALVLSLTPVLYYRNVFPYFYVVMLAPAAVLAGLAVEEARSLARRGATLRARDWLPGVVGLLILLQGGARLPLESTDEQQKQRAVLDAVHAIFPEPVPYIDHSGMVATFHKVNFFMSTWGLQEYRRQGKPFVAPALREYRPPLLLANTDLLKPGNPFTARLLPEDAEMLRRFYQPYWWPILVAGTKADLDSAETKTLELPFPGAYRLTAGAPVLIDGQLRHSGDVIEFAGPFLRVSWPQYSAGHTLEVKILWAAANAPPSGEPVFDPLYLFL